MTPDDPQMPTPETDKAWSHEVLTGDALRERRALSESLEHQRDTARRERDEARESIGEKLRLVRLECANKTGDILSWATEQFETLRSDHQETLAERDSLRAELAEANQATGALSCGQKDLLTILAACLAQGEALPESLRLEIATIFESARVVTLNPEQDDTPAPM